MPGVRIVGWGTYVPEQVLTNYDIQQLLIRKRLEAEGWLKRHGRPPMTEEQATQFETSDEWIQERIGFIERRVAPEKSTTDLGNLALAAALKQANMKPSKLDGIIVASVTPDHPYSPPNSTLVQHGIGLPAYESIAGSDKPSPRCSIFADISLACSSFIAALDAADSHIRAGKADCLAVLGCDVMSKVTVDEFNREFACILGDGAFAVI